MPLENAGQEFPYQMFKILIIDDVRTDLEFLAGVLSKKFSVIKASSAQEAVDIIRAEPVDLVLIDQMLGDDTGLNLSERLKKIRQDLRFVMISSSSSVNLATTALHSNMLEFIEKPVNTVSLLDKIDGVIQYIYTMHKQEEQINGMRDELARYKEKYGELK